MSIAEIARPEIRALSPYSAAEQVDDTIRLNANEAPWASPVDRFARPLNRYPEIRPAALRAALARRFGVEPASVLVTRGTSEAIDLLIRCFCEAGRNEILTTAPTFSMYRHYARIQNAAVAEIACDPADDFRPDPDAVIGAIGPDTRLVFLCSPNNPTGTLLPEESLRRILESARGRAAVVVDEAYIEFADTPSSVGLLERFDNLIVLRTLSKALAFAGARCGVAIAHADVIDLMDAVQAPYALATPVVECVAAALQGDALEEAGRQVAGIVAERQRLASRLEAYDFVRRVWPSAANFLLIEVDDANGVVDAVRRDGILVRQFGADLPDCIRISIGSATENDRLLESLDRRAGAVS